MIRTRSHGDMIETRARTQTQISSSLHSTTMPHAASLAVSDARFASSRDQTLEILAQAGATACPCLYREACRDHPDPEQALRRKQPGRFARTDRQRQRRPRRASCAADRTSRAALQLSYETMSHTLAPRCCAASRPWQ